MESSVSRRSFVVGAAALASVAGSAAGLGNPSLAHAEETSDITWEAEADFVIIGTGAAGLSAAATCGLEGLGDALIL